MRIAYFDCFSGCAGDMCLAALVDAGCDPAALEQAIAGLGPGREFVLSFEKTLRGAIAATRAKVEVAPAKLAGVRLPPPGAPGSGSRDPGPGPVPRDHPHRTLAQVLKLIDGAGLPARVAARAADVFRTLARGEAKVHGTTPDEVHFHEVGAIDAIVDICGTCAALEILGVDMVYASEACVGRGKVWSAHGELPAPGPAVLAILEGKPIRTRDTGHELTTPTGAALLVTLAGERMGPIPGMRLVATGVGAGEADFPSHANILRVLIGDVSEKGAPERCVVLEANLDDLTPQLVAVAIDALLAAGALDAFAVPCVMKKGRPGHLLTALAREGEVGRIEAVFFRETTTFGVRRRAEERTVLAREIVKVATEFGEVEVKVGRLEGSSVVTATPEFESAKRLAESKGLPVRAVLDAARAAAREIGR